MTSEGTLINTNRTPVKAGILPDFPQVIKSLEWAGISFGCEENYRLEMSLRNLLVKTKATNLRFWGKILTRSSDLFIAEGFKAEDFAEEIGETSEKRGTGVNRLTFWVTSDLLTDWVELPLVSPE